MKPDLQGPKMSIGKFSQLTRLSVRSLRFYDQVGLFRPLYTDPDTGYRYYQSEQFEIAERIRMFRSLELPLEDIRQILREDRPEVTRSILERHRKHIASQVQSYQRILQQLDQVSAEQRNYLVEEVHLSDRTLVAYSTISGLRDIERYRLEAVEKLSALSNQTDREDRVLYAIQTNALDPERMKGLLEHQRVLNPRAFEVTFGMVVPELQKALRLPMHPAVLPGGPYLKATHYGPYEPLHLAHQAMVKFAQQHSCALGDLCFECFEVGPWDQPASDMWITHVFYQLQTNPAVVSD
ncbi:MerR family transcriptional regulator [Deinococcus roseus]|uniref:HTH merR-type domain-containing protein n=1 Tax=Deinococcus roseus TaxID=392414 RepID=A0ABQ2DD62_9DEIO|nr:MerR family transcriptional regulator [Deinococcus roseus]GGJ54071.1 hypothetical protein GCM10008938_45150 [Deinococcus roseus]